MIITRYCPALAGDVMITMRTFPKAIYMYPKLATATHFVLPLEAFEKVSTTPSVLPKHPVSGRS